MLEERLQTNLSQLNKWTYKDKKWKKKNTNLREPKIYLNIFNQFHPIGSELESILRVFLNSLKKIIK